MVLGEQGQVLRAAVLGSPVAHSLSPALHRAAYAVLGLPQWSYERREVGSSGLGAFVADLDDTWRGLSLTMPLKEEAFDVAAKVTAIARDAGAVNTLVRRDDGLWDGHNTDVVGIVRAVEHVEHDGGAVILGSGATARSAALALGELGVRDVVVAARNAEASAEVVALLARHDIAAVHVPLEQWADDVRRLVISTLAPAASAAAGGSGGDDVRAVRRHAPRHRLCRLADPPRESRTRCRGGRRLRAGHARLPGGGPGRAVHRATRTGGRHVRGRPRGDVDAMSDGLGLGLALVTLLVVAAVVGRLTARELATGGYRIPEDEAEHAPPGSWWVAPLLVGLVLFVTFAVGATATYAALPAYLLFAWLTVCLVWIDLDVHRLPVGLTRPALPAFALLLVPPTIATGEWDRLLVAALCSLGLTVL